MIFDYDDIKYCKCNQCGHKWIPRMSAYKVKVCPHIKCHSYFWNENHIKVKRIRHK